MFLDSCLFVMKYLIIKVECVEGPGETEFRVWRIIMQVWAFYMQECKGTLSPLFLGRTIFTLVLLYHRFPVAALGCFSLPAGLQMLMG